MMATLLSKVQLLRDLQSLQAEAKAEEAKRQESLMQSSSKVRGERRKRRWMSRRAILASPSNSIR